MQVSVTYFNKDENTVQTDIHHISSGERTDFKRKMRAKHGHDTKFVFNIPTINWQAPTRKKGDPR